MTESQIRRLLLIAGIIILGMAGHAFILAGRGLIATVQPPPLPQYTIFLFAGQDRWVAVGYVFVLLLAALLPWFGPRFEWLAKRRVFLAVVLLTAFLALVSRFWVSHNFDLSLDEYLPRFQALIFQSGHLMASLSPEQFALNKILQPFFTYTDSTHLLWASYYRPGHALLLALLGLIGGEDLLNPIMAVVAIWAIAIVAKRMFPSRPDAPILAAALLLASPQFLITAGTGFSFSTHLAFNLMWLAAFLRGGWPGHSIAAFIGFWAIGLHQVHVHPLFSAPFLIALLVGGYGPRRYVWPYIFAYGLALPIWMMWPELAIWLQTGDTSVLPHSILEIEYIQNYLKFANAAGVTSFNLPWELLALNIMRFCLWISPALIVLILVGLAMRRNLGLTPMLLLASFSITVLVTHVLMSTQEQSWGSRYYHPVLGNLVLFGLAGYYALDDRVFFIKFRRVILALIVISILVFVPWRGLQVSEKVGPRAAVQMEIERIDADFVLIIARGFRYPYDFIRNRPDLGNRPLLVGPYNSEVITLPSNNVVELDGNALVVLGMPVGTMYEPTIAY